MTIYKFNIIHTYNKTLSTYNDIDVNINGIFLCFNISKKEVYSQWFIDSIKRI